MKRRILLVNPPICDFAAYDFWLKPYGLLRVAGQLRGQAEFLLFDYLDQSGAGGQTIESRRPSSVIGPLESDPWGRGPIGYERIESPAPLKNIPRYFRRFGLPWPD